MSIKNLAIRGSILRNTGFIIGICVYIGNDTKAYQKTQEILVRKQSWQVLKMHTLIYQLFALIFGIVLVLTIGGTVMRGTQDWPYIYGPDGPEMSNGVASIWAALENLVLISHTIPISIYVAIEVLKWLQVQIIKQDRELMKEPSDLNDLTAGLDIDINRREKARRELNMV